MKTHDMPKVKEALEQADASLGDTLRHFNAFFYLLKALVLAVCAIADEVRQLVADMPSHD